MSTGSEARGQRSQIRVLMSGEGETTVHWLPVIYERFYKYGGCLPQTNASCCFTFDYRGIILVPSEREFGAMPMIVKAQKSEERSESICVLLSRQYNLIGLQVACFKS
jgi:hypothetical protein